MQAREYRTGTRLVSPATGCQKKKMEASTTGPQTMQFSTVEHIVIYIWMIFFSCVISKGQCEPNSACLEHKFSLDANYSIEKWILDKSL